MTLSMGDWNVWLVAFLGFAAALAVGVALIAVNILRAHVARRRARIERLSPPRSRFREAMLGDNLKKLDEYCAANPTIGLITATNKLFGK